MTLRTQTYQAPRYDIQSSRHPGAQDFCPPPKVSANIRSVKNPLLLDQLTSVLYGFLTLEDGTDKLFRNVGKELPLLAAQQPRRTQFSSTVRRKPEVTQVFRSLRQLLHANSEQYLYIDKRTVTLLQDSSQFKIISLSTRKLCSLKYCR